MRAQRDLDAARRALAQAASIDRLLTGEGRRTLLADLDDATDRSSRAGRTLRASIPLRVIGVVPGLGHQRQGAILLARDATTASQSARSLTATLDRLDPQSRVAGARLPLAALAELEAEARRAAATLRPTVRRSASLWGPLNTARDRYDEQAADAATRLADAADALGAARTFAGENGPRRYLVAGQNNAEMRDQGMVLSYAVLRFDRGAFAVERTGSVTDLSLPRPAPLAVPAGTNDVFGALEPTRLWQSVNATADVSWSSTAMLDMYRSATGEQLDGVVMIDVPALVQLLRVIGPVTAEGIPEPVTAQNAPRLLLRDLYDRLPPGADQGPRRDAIAGVARASVGHIGSQAIDVTRLARGLSVAARGGHLRVYSRDADEQATFERIGASGGPAVPADRAGRTFHYAVQNATGTKLDFFVRHRVRLDVTTTEAGNAIVKTTITVQNGAPADAKASYVMGPTANQSRAGQYAGRVYVWGPATAEQFDSTDESALRLTERLVDVAPQSAAEVTVETRMRGAVADGVLELRLVPQPLLVPAQLEVVVDGRSRVATRWDRTFDLELAI